MKKTLLLLTALTLIILTSVDSEAQVRKIVLMEEATNASCPPCAGLNPGLQKYFEKNFGNIISVRSHAWWPGNDPMWDHNNSDNEAMINYYGINGVPSVFLDGQEVAYSNAFSSKWLTTKIASIKENLSPIEIIVNAEIVDNNYNVSVKVIAHADLSKSNMKLRAAIIERMIEYDSPPGGTDEKEFADVMRKFLPNFSGTEFESMTAGDIRDYDFSFPINSEWNQERLAAVAWVQVNNTKEIVQSNINMPTFVVDGERPELEIIEPNSEIRKTFSITNDNKEPLNLILKPYASVNPGNWEILVAHNGNESAEIVVTVPPSETIEFDFVLNTPNGTNKFEGGVFATCAEDNLGWGCGIPYQAYMVDGGVLLYDDDGGKSYDVDYSKILENLVIDHLAFNTSDYNKYFGNQEVAGFDLILWNLADNTDNISIADITMMKAHLDAGGQIAVFGQSFGEDIFEAETNSNFPEAQSFYNEYFDAKYVEANSGIYTCAASVGDNTFDGISFSLSIPYMRSLDVIESNSGNSSALLNYKDSEKIAALGYNNGTYNTALFSFGLEQIRNPNDKSIVLARVLSYFDIIDGVKEINDVLPTEYVLAQNYPNPFNPSTKIRFSIPESGLVSLKVFDMLGREIVQLVNEQKSVGNYEINFDGASLSSGIYLYKLDVNGNSFINKMMLMK